MQVAWEGRQCLQGISRGSKDEIDPVGGTELVHVKHKTIRHRRISSIYSTMSGLAMLDTRRLY